jgi:hypothetical protein
MEDRRSIKELCIVCRDAMTDLQVDNDQGMRISVCRQCLDASRENFIWICSHCRSVYIRPKSLVFRRLEDPGLMQAYLECQDADVIQGVDICIACDPQGVHQAVAASERANECGGHC